MFDYDFSCFLFLKGCQCLFVQFVYKFIHILFSNG